MRRGRGTEESGRGRGGTSQKRRSVRTERSTGRSRAESIAVAGRTGVGLLVVLAAIPLVAAPAVAIATVGPGGTVGSADGAATPAPGVLADGDPAVRPASAVTPNGSAGEELVDGGTYFLGQVLRTDAFEPGDDVTLRRPDGTLVAEVPVGDDGVVTLETARRSPGEFVLTAPGGPELTFELVRQEYGVEASQGSVAPRGPETNVTFRITSNREGYRQAVSSPDLSATTLRSVFGTGEVADADGDGVDELLVPGGLRTTLPADFEGVDPGRYDLEFSVLDTTANATRTVTVLHAPPETALLADPSKVVTEERGDVARIPLALENADRATVTVGSQAVGWRVRATVRDTDDDGDAVLLVDTDLAGRVEDPGRAVRAADATLVNVSRTAGEPFEDPDRRLAGGGYPISVIAGGEETDVGTLFLRDPSAVERRVAVATARGPLDRRAIREAAVLAPLNGSEAPRGGEGPNLAYAPNVTVAKGDYLAIAIRIAGVFGALARAENASDTPAGVGLRIEEAAPGPNEEPDAVDPRNFSVVTDPARNRIALVADAGNPDFEAGETYRVTLELTPENPYVDERIRRSATFEVDPRRATVDGNRDRLRVMAVGNATLSGEATVADGTRLRVRIRSAGAVVEGAEPFLRTSQVTVENGTWTATFDLSDAHPGQRFTATVAGAGYPTEVRGVVTRPAGVRMASQLRGDERVVTVDRVTVPEGGFVAIHGQSLLDGEAVESVLGSSTYLPPGPQEGLTITLDEPLPEGTSEIIAIVYRDTDDDATYDYVSSDGSVDVPYRVNGSPVSDTAQIQVPSDTTRSPTPTATPPPTDQCPPTCQPTRDQTPTPTPSTAGTDRTPTRTVTPTTVTTRPPGVDEPGFGVAVAVVAILLAAVLAVRRRD